MRRDHPAPRDGDEIFKDRHVPQQPTDLEGARTPQPQISAGEAPDSRPPTMTRSGIGPAACLRDVEERRFAGTIWSITPVIDRRYIDCWTESSAIVRQPLLNRFRPRGSDRS